MMYAYLDVFDVCDGIHRLYACVEQYNTDGGAGHLIYVWMTPFCVSYHDLACVQRMQANNLSNLHGESKDKTQYRKQSVPLVQPLGIKAIGAFVVCCRAHLGWCGCKL